MGHTDFRKAEYFTAGGAMSTVQDMQQRGFPGSRAANHAHQLAGMEVKADVIEHGLLRIIRFTQVAHA